MLDIRDIKQNSDEWHEMRSLHITASDMPIIMSENPWINKHKLWKQKMGLIEGPFQNQRMVEGSRLEEYARDYFSKRQNCTYSPKVVVSRASPFIMASLDGLDASCSKVLEIKCGEKSHEYAKKGEIPRYYYGQLQCQLYVTELDRLDYLSYRSDDDVVVLSVNRDDEYIETMVKKAKEFYDCLTSFKEPSLNDGVLHREDEEFIEAAKRFISVQKSYEELKKEYEDAREARVFV